MKTIGYYMRKANMAVEEAMKAESNYVVEIYKPVFNRAQNMDELLETAKKTYQTAKRHVKNVYAVLELDAPKMSGIHSVQIHMERINTKFAAFWEDIQNNK